MRKTTEKTEESIWRALDEVMDPEIPVVSVVEMGIVRRVELDADGRVTVTMTPTFAGCPALEVMEREIEARVRQMGFESVVVETVLAPAWSSDWISDEARRKLKGFGLAPPKRHDGQVEVTFFEPAVCPRCDSTNTSVKNAFGPTLCRAIYVCNACQEPFEQFKAL